jgi:hypothetical protein
MNTVPALSNYRIIKLSNYRIITFIRSNFFLQRNTLSLVALTEGPGVCWMLRRSHLHIC